MTKDLFGREPQQDNPQGGIEQRVRVHRLLKLLCTEHSTHKTHNTARPLPVISNHQNLSKLSRAEKNEGRVMTPLLGPGQFYILLCQTKCK